ncbi:MAG TPA: prepilin-type N-terminal cleavage/methylation domain-containing protein [Clostridia bacterium]|jgi:prepilin-type N-terminal cleavage/methylation domain-containing protein|nr:prepilin-type N-terminal cleavage/methylation domain-containing protein [Clostridia bacterium]
MKLNNKGFTFIELLVVAVILGILLTIAYPRLEKVRTRWELNGVARQMVSDIRKMQQKAVVEQITGLNITLNQAARKYYLKENSKVLESRDLSRVITGISVKPKDFTIVEFYTNGMTSGAGTIALSNRYGEFRYIVILNTTGRVRISSTPP